MTIEKSKKVLETSNNAQIRARIEVLEGVLKKSGNQLGKEAGLGNGTVDRWTDKHLEISKPGVALFLAAYKIRSGWWETMEGDIFITKPTQASDEQIRDETVDRLRINERDAYLKVIAEKDQKIIDLHRKIWEMESSRRKRKK
jgi:hypothetical protein